MSMSSYIHYLACSKEGNDVTFAFLGMTARFMAEAVVHLYHYFHFESSLSARIIFAYKGLIYLLNVFLLIRIFHG